MTADRSSAAGNDLYLLSVLDVGLIGRLREEVVAVVNDDQLVVPDDLGQASSSPVEGIARWHARDVLDLPAGGGR